MKISEIEVCFGGDDLPLADICPRGVADMLQHALAHLWSSAVSLAATWDTGGASLGNSP